VNPSHNDKFLFIGSLNSESKVYGQKIGSILREIRPDVVIENYLGEANVSKQLKKASSLGFKFVMIIGQEEIKSKRFKVKELNNSNADFLIEENNLAEIFND
jgi:histidyl-tRNA synthetase